MPITTPILSFIEEIMIKYNLEDDLVKDDFALQKQLSDKPDLSYRSVLKLLFGTKIKELRMAGKSLEEILPSVRLKTIIESLINKKSSYNELPGLIKKDLNLDDEKTNEIVGAIKNNIEIIKLINQPLSGEVIENHEEEANIEEEKINTTNKKSIANMLLR
jgi:hypothetical protein